jgi:hypothetical protein
MKSEPIHAAIRIVKAHGPYTGDPIQEAIIDAFIVLFNQGMGPDYPFDVRAFRAACGDLGARMPRNSLLAEIGESYGRELAEENTRTSSVTMFKCADCGLTGLLPLQGTCPEHKHPELYEEIAPGVLVSSSYSRNYRKPITLHVKQWLQGWGVTDGKEWFAYYYDTEEEANEVCTRIAEQGREIIIVNVNREAPLVLKHRGLAVVYP